MVRETVRSPYPTLVGLLSIPLLSERALPLPARIDSLRPLMLNALTKFAVCPFSTTDTRHYSISLMVPQEDPTSMSHRCGTLHGTAFRMISER